MSFHRLTINDVDPDLILLRSYNPLVHCMTNEVVQEFTANVLLAIGASPAMVVAQEEAGDFAGIADALLINVGTLYPERAAAMQTAILAANKKGTPWVLDPVAAGALRYRTEFIHTILPLQPTAIRGNASEIMALAGQNALGKGADSTQSSESALSSAQLLAQRYNTIVAVTGKTDYITDGLSTITINWGHEMMTRVVGTGCSLSAVIAAFLSINKQPLQAVSAACAFVAIAGQHAAIQCQGTGSFISAFLDALNAESLMNIYEA